MQVRNAEMFTLRITLNNLEEILPSEAFLRTHRWYIVSVEHIEAINFQDSTLMQKKLMEYHSEAFLVRPDHAYYRPAIGQ
ncbi:LytTR family DNA-binding domain-containing protein [Phaeodactylibacter xiamenensis]|uniref:LytTR family DNA-binding domain-containing protein n=1 Tax=Phaeodactylibacter xiamenensis TaxID=1524460 RepID=UPI003D0E9063